MAKPIPKVGSRGNGRNNAQKSARRIPKGVIHVQASFNNTIVTIADVRGQVISWSSVGTCGFKGTRRGTPYSSSSRPRGQVLKGLFRLSRGMHEISFEQASNDHILVLQLEGSQEKNGPFRKWRKNLVPE
ncbi:30S ribosomal protein S11, chloroplastic-like [Gossypium raimondii]|uniref:30S ribosomal protein S11, chloroplastic-like n=1 Tax=Gossypium raimondii TaxID=29730 RepID=UPI00227AF621|nr:30S ribosomal protein S11, chloroplastic-like [Gossypium raimondii]